ncbi:iron-containing redox enzyme family protein [Vitiosangium sp. GDMCC 1.1324]|uniref:iron-containing redox enzyme family protein n=1 Tax=Vitiosangium sp. (strain GDMCC 1.1324) TaxID=2138576 RepID=UPI000D382072|nr:iron-containing redox enzyme family protein [Vitiosangium sp. GDMCC 1.1324]PTL82217.1 heme oxygenase [Vitiosangium sp. GDMCC 1.1324]
MHTRTGTQTQADWTSALEHEARTLVEELDAYPAARSLFEGTLDAEGYAHYLVQTYHYVRWSTPLLAAAGLRMKRQGQLPLLAELLLQKASEERGHERWLLADLGNLGWPATRVEGTEPGPAVTAYIAWNRYTTLAGVPTAFLGTAYVLEYLSVQRASGAVERLIAANTIPNIRKAVTFLRGHGNMDGDHVAELTSVLRSLMDPGEQSALLLSARITRTLYAGFLSGTSSEQPARTS